MKDLLSCSQNKETLAIFLAAQLIECKKDSQTTYVVTSKADCMTSNSLPIQHLRSEQEEADTRMLLHALDATQRGATSITIHSPDTDVLVLTLWVYKRLCPDTTVIVGTGGKRRSIPLGPLYEAHSTRPTLRGPLFLCLMLNHLCFVIKHSLTEH